MSREPESSPRQPSPGLGESRLRQLRADMALTPEQRVRVAEETARLSERPRRPAVQYVVMFERYEDYLDWKYASSRSG